MKSASALPTGEWDTRLGHYPGAHCVWVAVPVMPPHQYAPRPDSTAPTVFHSTSASRPTDQFST
jgi:hypothetical protein